MVHVTEAQARHPSFELLMPGSDEYWARATIGLQSIYEAEEFEGEFDLTFEFPKNYPRRPPSVYDYSHQIPLEFAHVFVDTRALCFGAPVEVNRIFAEEPSLSKFLERLVEPYLFAAIYTARKGKPPYSCLPHGSRGLLEYYARKFGTDEFHTIRLLKVLADGDRLGRWSCPCESGSRVNRCHGETLASLQPHRLAREFARELNSIVETVQKSGDFYPAKHVRPRSFLRQRDQNTRRQARSGRKK